MNKGAAHHLHRLYRPGENFCIFVIKGQEVQKIYLRMGKLKEKYSSRQVTLKIFIQRPKKIIQGKFHAARKFPPPPPQLF